jgi:hypothetical protein
MFIQERAEIKLKLKDYFEKTERLSLENEILKENEKDLQLHHQSVAEEYESLAFSFKKFVTQESQLRQRISTSIKLLDSTEEGEKNELLDLGFFF